MPLSLISLVDWPEPRKESVSLKVLNKYVDVIRVLGNCEYYVLLASLPEIWPTAKFAFIVTWRLVG